jgi:hypothetical protein
MNILLFFSFLFIFSFLFLSNDDGSKFSSDHHFL